MKSLLLDKRLAIFAACVVLFFAAGAAIGPVVAARVTRRWPDFATLIIAATILLPQAIVAAISPWIGRRADRSGRRPLLLLGWGLLPVQGFLYAALPGVFALVLGNLLNGVSGAIFGVTMTVVAADLTRRRRLQSTLGALGVAISVGASLSTFFTGISAALFGRGWQYWAGSGGAMWTAAVVGRYARRGSSISRQMDPILQEREHHKIAHPHGNYSPRDVPIRCVLKPSLHLGKRRREHVELG
jgi:MFS family permease